MLWTEELDQCDDQRRWPPAEDCCHEDGLSLAVGDGDVHAVVVVEEVWDELIG